MDQMEQTEQLEALFNEGNYAELESRARLLIEQSPSSGFGWSVLGASLQMQGKEALHVIQKVAELLPNDAVAHRNLGSALLDIGQLDNAATSFRQALEVDSDFFEAHNYLGIILKKLGRLDEAEASFRRALQIAPDLAETYFNLGLILKEMGRLDEAETSYRHALQIKPDFAEAYTDLGNILKELGRLDEAETSYRLALRINPDFAETLNNLGTVLQELKRFDEAEATFRKVLILVPHSTEAHYNLGLTLTRMGRINEAESSYRDALQINPDFAEAHNKQGELFFELSRFDDAEAAFRNALRLKPDLQEAYTNLLFQLTHSDAIDGPALFAEHQRFAKQFETPLRPDWPRHANSRNPSRVLQVGFVSGDLRNHAVASFIEPVLTHLASRPQLSLHAYHNHGDEDSVTRRLRAYMAHWHPIVHLSDAALAQKIQEDGIDILIDLSGHTAKNRLLTFARKPAPVQVSWMGYAGTTGLSAMDYYLTDRHFLPTGQFDNQFSEKLVQLPASAPFMPLDNAPPVNPLPALHNGYVTFASFNGLRKLTPSVVALWSQLLRALPTARLVLGGLPTAGVDNIHNMLSEWFSKEGIGRERLSFHSRCPMKDYLNLHHKIDICLDTFPYPGATTSCHALWMGVPTLTLAGSTPVSRVGASLLNHVGLRQFVTFDKNAFVEKGLYWGGNIKELAKVREELRVRFKESGIGQPEVIATALEKAMRIMWQRWCSGLPTEAFEVPATGV